MKTNKFLSVSHDEKQTYQSVEELLSSGNPDAVELAIILAEQQGVDLELYQKAYKELCFFLLKHAKFQVLPQGQHNWSFAKLARWFMGIEELTIEIPKNSNVQRIPDLSPLANLKSISIHCNRKGVELPERLWTMPSLEKSYIYVKGLNRKNFLKKYPQAAFRYG